ncbi:MAG: hypothetical protein JWN13_6728 [Betaproteobacteria bacterium]|jgi:hypothetical protein|nr:hypothetical protein [Betaproteobacteria bacterium]
MGSRNVFDLAEDEFDMLAAALNLLVDHCGGRVAAMEARGATPDTVRGD